MKLKSISDQQFQNVLPNTAKYALGRKALVFQKSKFC